MKWSFQKMPIRKAPRGILIPLELSSFVTSKRADVEARKEEIHENY
jgi:hypothetical protein